MTVFSPREQQILAGVADAVIPPGALFGGGDDPATLARYEALLHAIEPRSLPAIRALLYAVEGAGMSRYLKPFSALSRDKRQRVLESWHGGDAVRRNALRLLTLPLKLSHFNDPDKFAQFDCPHVPTPAAPEPGRWRQQIVGGEALEGEEVLEAEVVVVGTGAGGAVVAKELAQRGHAVLMLEEGEHYDRKDFTSVDRVELNRRMFRENGALTTVGNTFIALPVGRTVGGTTTVNSGTCFRTPNKVLRQWREDLGLRDFTEAAMTPIFERVERTIGVEEASWDHLGRVAEVIRDGCEALGYSHHPLHRNATGCDGQGVCCFGCPTDAKRSTNVTYIPLALKKGAMCVTGCRVDGVLIEGGRATGVECSLGLPDGRRRRLVVRAPYVVLACGSVYTPLLLLKCGLGNRWDQVGRNLSIHPAFGMGAVFDSPIRGWDGIPQGYCIDQFHGEGILFEGASVPLEFGSIAFPLIGDDFTRAMEAYDRLAIFGFMISDTSRGRVRLGPGGRPLVTYMLNRNDMRRIHRGAVIMGDVFFAAGAERLYNPIAGHETIHDLAGLDALAGARIRASDVELSAYHPLGTCRLGVDPRTSVTDPRHEAHEIGNLFIVDGSSVPSALGVNPQVTIMSMATRFAELLDRRISATARGAKRKASAA